MNIDSFNIIVLVSFYIIGSLPFALIVHRLLSTDDPRTSGSNNPGATNMYRVAGPIAGFLTFLGDFLKGFLPIYLLTFNEPLNAYLYSLVILLGHMFSVFNNFKRWKGSGDFFWISFSHRLSNRVHNNISVDNYFSFKKNIRIISE